MCKGYVAHSASIDALFVGTNEVPTVEPKNVSKEVNASGSDQRDPPTSSPTPRSIILPDIKPFVGHRFWPREKPVTRPPLPSQFSAGSFQIAFNVTQNMSPSCRMLVYYVRNRETIADSKVIDIEDSFANKVSRPVSHIPQWSPTSGHSQIPSSLTKLFSYQQCRTFSTMFSIVGNCQQRNLE